MRKIDLLQPGAGARRVVFLAAEADLPKTRKLRGANRSGAKIYTLQPSPGDDDLTLLYDCLPADLHRQTAAVCDPILARWEALLGVRHPLPRGIGARDAGSNHLLTLPIEARIKVLLCVQAMLARERPAVLWYSRSFAPYVAACGLVEPGFGGRAARVLRRLILAWAYVAFSLAYQFVYKWLRARWRDRGKAPLAMGSGETLCIGEESLLYNLSDQLCDAKQSGADPALLTTMDWRGQRRRQLATALKGNARYVDTLGTWTDRVVAAAATVRLSRDIALHAFRERPGGSAAELSPDQRRIWRLLEWDVIRYVLTVFPLVMLHRRIASWLIDSWTPGRLFVSNPASWALEAYCLECRKRGIATASYTHGMVESALAYRSRTDYFYVCGQFDASLLASYRGPSAILPVGPSLVRQNPAPTCAPARLGGKAVLLTSGVGAAGLHKRIDFFCETLASLCAAPGSDFEEIIIKLHPFERHGSVRRDLERVRNRFPQLAGRLRVQSGDLSGALSGASVAFLMPSTTLMDCLRLDIPFFLFDTGDFDRNTFYGQLPAITRYRSREELSANYRERLADLDLNAAIAAAYYGPQSRWAEGRDHLRGHLGGRSLAASER